MKLLLEFNTHFVKGLYEPCIFCYYTFFTKNIRLVLYFEKQVLENGFRSYHLFLFYFKRENKIRKKTLSMIHDKEKQVWEKSSLGPSVRLLIEKVR